MVFYDWFLIGSATILVGYFPSYRRRAGHPGIPRVSAIPNCGWMLGNKKIMWVCLNTGYPNSKGFCITLFNCQDSVVDPSFSDKPRYQIIILNCVTLYDILQWYPRYPRYVIILNNLLFIVTMDIPSFPAANVIPTVSLNSLGGASWWSWRRSFGPRLTRFCVQYFPGNKPGNWTLLYLKQTKMSNLLKINDILVCFLKGPDKVFQYLC